MTNTSRNPVPAIIALLRTAPAPLRIAEIAAALRLTHSEELRDTIGRLVRDKRLERHHDQTGLRYSLTAAEAAKQPRHASESRARARLDESVRIVECIEKAGGAIRVTRLNIELRSFMPKWRVHRNLTALAADGTIHRAGTRHLAQVWFPHCAPLDIEPPVQVSAIDGRNLNGPANRAPPDRVLAALVANLSAARAALSAYRRRIAKGATA